MSSYIDRDLILAGIEDLKKSPWYNGCNENYESLIRREAIDIVAELCIKQAPAADVAEVKHGEWVHGECVSHCSECGVETYPENITPYCPNCGLRMDGGDFDEMPNNKSKE